MTNPSDPPADGWTPPELGSWAAPEPPTDAVAGASTGDAGVTESLNPGAPTTPPPGAAAAGYPTPPTPGYPQPAPGYPQADPGYPSGGQWYGAQPAPGYNTSGGWQQPGYAPAPPRPPLRENTPLLRGLWITVAVASFAGLIGTLFSLYSVEGDIPDAGKVQLGIGYLDSFPISAPLIAIAVPIALLVALLTAIPGIVKPQHGSRLPALFAPAAAIVSIFLMISSPLPSVAVSGQLKTELSEETGYSSIDSLIDRYVDISPGAGAIVALTFALVAAIAAGVLFVALREPAAGPAAS